MLIGNRRERTKSVTALEFANMTIFGQAAVAGKISGNRWLSLLRISPKILHLSRMIIPI